MCYLTSAFVCTVYCVLNDVCVSPCLLVNIKKMVEIQALISAHITKQLFAYIYAKQCKILKVSVNCVTWISWHISVFVTHLRLTHISDTRIGLWDQALRNDNALQKKIMPGILSSYHPNNTTITALFIWTACRNTRTQTHSPTKKHLKMKWFGRF